MKLLLVQFVGGIGQLALVVFKSFGIEKQGRSVTHRVLAYLFQVAVRLQILLDIKDGDALLDSLLEILNTSPAHRRLIHALRLRR